MPVSKPALSLIFAVMAAPAFAFGPVQFGAKLAYDYGPFAPVIEAKVEHCKGASLCNKLKQKCKDNRGVWSPLQTNAGGRATIGSCST